MKTFDTHMSKITYSDKGIMRVELKEGVNLKVEHLEENLSVYKKLLGENESALFLLIFAQQTIGDNEVRAASADPRRSSLKRAEAMVIKNMGQRIETSFYKKFFDLPHPVQVFDNEEEAINWLLSIELYETKISTIQRLDHDVLKIIVKPDVVIDKESLDENLKLYKKLLPEGGYFINIFQTTNTASNDAKIPFQAQERISLKKGEAFVIKNLANRIELEYHINKTKQLYPTKVFEEEEAAMEFIKDLKSQVEEGSTP